MSIKERFLRLTTRTYPHGTECQLSDILGPDIEMDEHGNYFKEIGDYNTMFTSHLDTATSDLVYIEHVVEDNIIKTDGKTILGADDKAGVTIMLYMIENKIPGLYYFFVGEECGCIGSSAVSERHILLNKNINKVVSFDRRGKNSIITFQRSKRCCSDKFAKKLAEELNSLDRSFLYKEDDSGLLTDSCQFTSIYPECTNISVGYNHEHTNSEQQDIEHLERLAKACLLINWSNLPIERDPSKVEWKNYNYYNRDYNYNNYNNYNNYGYGDWDDYDDDFGYGGSGSSRYYGSLEKTRKEYLYDEKYQGIIELTVEIVTNRITEVKMVDERIDDERRLINKLLKDLELNFTSFKWDGMTLIVHYKTNNYTSCDRNDIITYIQEMDYLLNEKLLASSEIY
jgi:hypothetical protein